jgi:restriction system protein
MYPILYLCNSCNWWHSNKEGRTNGNGIKSYSPDMYYPILGEVDISSDSILLEELTINLLKNWEDRKLISAGKAESLVQSILKEHLSCDVHSSTANVNKSDGGIDLHVCSKSGQIIRAVQVKRRISKDTEPVSEIRNFVGAMEIEGIKKGIFVTTAERFTKPAQKIPEKLKRVNSRLELELIDGQRLFELLKCNIKPELLIIPPDIDMKSIWVSQSGEKFNTLSLLYSEQ